MNNHQYAIKIINPRHFKRDKLESIEQEIKIHRPLSHKNIVQFYDYFQIEKLVHLVMEMCENQVIIFNVHS